MMYLPLSINSKNNDSITNTNNNNKCIHTRPYIYMPELYYNTCVFVHLLTEQYHIFVGDLSAEIETQQLKDAFSPFGEIS